MTRISSITEISLTPMGRKKVEDMSGSGSAFAALAHLYESGGMTFGELKVALKTNDGRMLSIVKVLKKEGYVKVGGGMGGSTGGGEKWLD